VRSTLALIVLGSVAGALLVAALAPVGPRLGLPSVVAARATLGTRGAALLAAILYLTNFAWIAANNLIAASALAGVSGASSERAWILALGAAATLVVMAGPRAVGLADRVAVPLMLLTGAALTWRLVGAVPPQPAPAVAADALGGRHWLAALDVVIGYQVSWILMFADYSRYTASARAGFWAVFLGLALSSLWFMPLGLLGARLAGSGDAGAILAAAGLGSTGAVLMALASLTTNFVNIYLSALAFKSLWPRAGDRASIAAIGALGTGLGLLPGAGLARYVDFMLLLAALLVPVGGVLLARLVLPREPLDAAALADPRGPYARGSGLLPGALVAWGAGVVVYFGAQRWGSATLPALATSFVLALATSRRDRRQPASTARG
jgi:NCS1 family nucleobase:cation symporter-1